MIFKKPVISLCCALCGILTIASCAHQPKSESLARRPASADDGVPPTLDYPLYKNEHWKGSREEELADFAKISNEIATAQRALQSQRKASSGDRVFHEKQHGCLVGHLKILNDRPGDSERRTFQGMFSGTKSDYTVLARFSNGVGKTQHDLQPDVRGFGMKIFGVTDESDGVEKTVDFTMTDSTTPFGVDTDEFVSFMNASVQPGFGKKHLLAWFLEHRKAARVLLKTSLKHTSSLTELQFWAGHPYLLNPNLAMKLNVKPEQSAKTDSTSTDWKSVFPDSLGYVEMATMWAHGDWDSLLNAEKEVHANYLGEDLAEKASSESIKYILSVQLEKDTVSTPIEDNLTEWKEEASPSIPVAELVFQPQKIDDEELENLCHQARFTPGHYVSQHRPLSNMGRGRMFAYQASQVGRGASTQEVDEKQLLKIETRIESLTGP